MRSQWLSTHLGFMAVVAAVLTLCGGYARAQTSTTFTYQGQLDEGGVAADGSYDLRFSVLDTQSGPGNVLSTAICRDNVSVVNGLLEVTLDFGVGAWLSATNAFLQVEVRPDATVGNCATGTYTALTPRSRFTAAPRSASTRGITVSQDGKVGLGGFSPLRGLSMVGGVLIQDANNEGITLSTNTLEIADANDEIVYRYSAPPQDRHDFLNAGESTLTLAPGGFVGLGTQNPAARVHMLSTLNRPSFALIESSYLLPPGSAVSTPARSPAAVTVASGPSTWISLDSARISDGSFASNPATGAGGLGAYGSQTVRFSNFGFAVPSNATITGLSISVATSNQITFNCSSFNLTASIRATPRTPTLVGSPGVGATLVNAPGTASMGGISQSFGQVWTPAQVNSSSFAIDVEPRVFCSTLTSNLNVISCGCGPSGNYRIDGISVVVHYVIGSAAVEQSTWSVGVGPGKSTFALAPTADLSSPSLVLVRDGRVGVGVEPTGNSGPRLEVAGNVQCVSLTETSSARFKTNVSALSNPLESVLALQPVRFRWDTAHGGRDDIGFLAEQVQAIAPALVTTDQSGEAAGMNYGRIGVLTVGAIQELKNHHDRQVAELQARAERLDAENADLKARLLQLEQRLNAMSGVK